MDNLTLREAPTQNTSVEKLYENGPSDNNVGPSTDIMPEPIDGESMPQSILDVLGIDDDVRNLPSDELANLREISSYLEDKIVSVGKIPNVNTMGRELDSIRDELGMDDQTEPSVLLDRLGGVVKAWKNLGFIKNPSEKRSLFMKLARCKDSKEMHKLIFAEMESKKIWQ